MPCKRTIDAYRRGNAEACAVILADPEKYAGGLLDWAEAWSEKPADGSAPKMPANRARKPVAQSVEAGRMN